MVPKNKIKKLIKYFRQSLIDSERLSPTDKLLKPVLGIGKPTTSNDYVRVEKSSWLSGEISTDVAVQILNIKSKAAGKELFSTEVLLIPRTDLLVAIGGSTDDNKRHVLIPLLVIAKLNRSGQLTPTDKPPWIPREWLSPSQSADMIIADTQVVDDFLTVNPFEGIDTWQQLNEYCCKMLMCVLSPDSDQELLDIFSIDISDQYKQSNTFLIQLDAPIKGAKKKILTSYDALIDSDTLPLLLQRYCALSEQPLDRFEDQTDSLTHASTHYGQMTGEFPLSKKQRNALHFSFDNKDGEILAVNGPPGTGKTTLLRSVVADRWVNAALEKSEPPIIIAASNNNQAVTNILESFASVDEEGMMESLKGRWIPNLDSYGLYCCSSKAKNKKKYTYFVDNTDSSMLGLQTREYLEEASAFFIDKGNRWKKISIPSIGNIQAELHKELLKTKQQMQLGFTLYKKYCDINCRYIKLFGSLEKLDNSIAELVTKITSNNKSLKTILSNHDEFLALWEQRSIWTLLFFWLAPIKNTEHQKTKRLAMKLGLNLSVYDDPSVEKWFDEKSAELKHQQAILKNDLTSFQQKREDWAESLKNIKSWIDSHKPSNMVATDYFDQVNEISDRVLRFKMFKLATHYWEAEWLSELITFINSGDEDKNSPHKLVRRLKRFAKITPCMVSTFYMIPALLTAYEKTNNVWRNIPLFKEVDLLIVDEAGQALPEVSAASFAFAKQALIVGDIDQIEPVWSVPVGVDRSNLIGFELVSNEEEYEQFWIKSGLMASNGNVMKVCQRQSTVQQFTHLQRGLYLTEHRRCYDDIIEYCNALVYQDVLEAMRGSPKNNVPFGQLSFVSVDSPSNRFGGSRGNIGEANVIIQWLTKNANLIVEYARAQDKKLGDLNDNEVFTRSVAVVTPFSKQAKLIKSKSKGADLPQFTVGTVHSLQGDEKLIVLFSSVYGENDRGMGKFYDAKPNMLNVAVSRAKDSFIVFGNSSVFGKDAAGSPSGLLRQRLKPLKLPVVASDLIKAN